VYLILIITCKAKGVLQILIQSRFIISTHPNEGYVGVYSLSKSRFFKEIFHIRMAGANWKPVSNWTETGFLFSTRCTFMETGWVLDRTGS
jgi:hypothetical protein